MTLLLTVTSIRHAALGFWINDSALHVQIPARQEQSRLIDLDMEAEIVIKRWEVLDGE